MNHWMQTLRLIGLAPLPVLSQLPDRKCTVSSCCTLLSLCLPCHNGLFELPTIESEPKTKQTNKTQQQQKHLFLLCSSHTHTTLSIDRIWNFPHTKQCHLLVTLYHKRMLVGTTFFFSIRTKIHVLREALEGHDAKSNYDFCLTSFPRLT